MIGESSHLVASNLPQAEVSTFDDALRMYGKKADVNAYNHENMKFLGVPVKQIKAHHTGQGAEKADWETRGNLHKSLPLSIDARVILIGNCWTKRGQVNGPMGTVTDFHWLENAGPDKDIPTVLVAFDKYDGPFLYKDAFGRMVALSGRMVLITGSLGWEENGF